MSILVPTSKHPPSLDKAKTVTEIAGKNATFFNLKDNEWFNNRKIAIVGVRTKQGEYGEYLLLGCWLYPEVDNDPDNQPVPVVIMTGSENVVNRVFAVLSEISEETPVVGTLRKISDAWILD
jgi:hypothetical protein